MGEWKLNESRSIFLGNPHWLPAVIAIGLILTALTIWSYRNSRMPGRWRPVAITLRVIGFTLILVCLLEPMGSIERAKPQANSFAVLVDNSQSAGEFWDWNAGVRTADESQRGEWLRQQMRDESGWNQNLESVFRVRRFFFDSVIQSIDSLERLTQDGSESALIGAVQSVNQRFAAPEKKNISHDSPGIGRSPKTDRATGLQPLGGILLFSDGQATDRDILTTLENSSVPVYPVLSPAQQSFRDIAIDTVVTTLSDFETAPASMAVSLKQNGFAGETVVVELKDLAGEVIERQNVELLEDARATKVDFQFRPKEVGVQGVQVVVSLPTDPDTAVLEASGEATIHNNVRHQVIDRGTGPYRVLYISGRPNWEFKFLARGLSQDPEIELTSLIRIAKREPKFSFRETSQDGSNPLFSGFEDLLDEEKEQYDEPVYVRLGLKEAGELQKGFPASVEELFKYHAVIIDDIEDDFFTRDQASMLRQFVSARGGGLLALAGQESMRGDTFSHTELGQMLPVYGDPEHPRHGDYTDNPNDVDVQELRVDLTREGWLQPFMRLASTEINEKKRLEAMPSFQVWNRVRSLKPGATLLAAGRGQIDGMDSGEEFPIFATQRFGRGRTAALLIGDWWRWEMHQDEPKKKNDPSQLSQAWRQMVRWLITDVPPKVELSVHRIDESTRSKRIQIDLKDDLFKSLDNAAVEIEIKKPDGTSVTLSAEPTGVRSGEYQAYFVSALEGVYIAQVRCAAPDGSHAGTASTGWVYEPLAAEFQSLGEDRALLERLAELTGGRTIAWNELDSFTKNLPGETLPITERQLFSLWHQSWVLVIALACLCTEWGWRRRYGMA